MQRRVCLLAVLVFAISATAVVSAQSDDGAPGAAEIRQLLATAQRQIAAGDFEAAGTTLDSAFNLGPRSARDASVLLYLRGQVFYELGEPARAVSLWNQALTIGGLPEAQQQALEAALARLAERAAPAKAPASPQELLQAAAQAMQFGRGDEATTYYAAAIDGFGAVADASGLARAHYGFGTHLATKRDFEGALIEYAMAIEQAELAGDAPLQRSLLGAIGAAAVSAGRLEEGRNAFAKLLELLGDAHGTPRAAALAGLAEASLRLKDWPAAIDAYEQWLTVRDAPQNPALSQRMLHSHALALRLAGRTDDALAAIARLDADAESDDERGRLALQLEQDGTRARALESSEVGCWFDARARERYVALGRTEDAETLLAVIEAEGCAETAND